LNVRITPFQAGLRVVPQASGVSKLIVRHGLCAFGASHSSQRVAVPSLLTLWDKGAFKKLFRVRQQGCLRFRGRVPESSSAEFTQFWKELTRTRLGQGVWPQFAEARKQRGLCPLIALKRINLQDLIAVVVDHFYCNLAGRGRVERPALGRIER